MRLPLPRNRLVLLTLVGGVVSAGAAFALATPGVLMPDANEEPPPDDVPREVSGAPAETAAATPDAPPAPPSGPAPPTEALPEPPLVDAPPIEGPLAPTPYAPEPYVMTERDFEAAKKQAEWQAELAKKLAEADDG